ncbi:hypothetical protein [Ruegeria sp. EL01]|jgi:hypothetical protein|uniref:hypothetical protein n=1 Tax=Ruegeria sp. EL01 TaxID=2107578 RepID=UPI000EA7F743|nr:hypothetical protein [Ruegeria sp. EL01]
MSGQKEWWRDQIPDGEEVLWVGHPDQGLFPPRIAWVCKVAIALIAFVWLSSPWLIDTVRGFWKISACTIGFMFVLYADRFVRSQRVYVVTSLNALELNKTLKSKQLKIDRFLTFSHSRRRLAFGRHPFFSFDQLSDPDAALKALSQAREAST